ncbi:GldM-like protein [Kordia periserrulae]|uniref:GldM-like protein n=1 Tax=Kordia periserrulae TaxID=701523 RepID=A0A2T6BS25_9FLAO|nr:hypothetical protein [Kordia periserrulae]PTX58767.1 GldM-like protein [Kordia periserrulae]
MSPKAILIAFVIVSLLLIGVMFLAVDGRNNATVPKFETATGKEASETEKLEDSLKTDTQTEDVKLEDFITTSVINLNEGNGAGEQINQLISLLESQPSSDRKADLEKFVVASRNIITQIKKIQEALFPGGMEKYDIGESPKVQESNAVFFKENEEHSELSKQLLTDLNTFENALGDLQKIYPEFRSVNTKLRDEYSDGMDWLTYNFKDFPAVASYVKLSTIMDEIETNQEIIIKAMLPKQ